MTAPTSNVSVSQHKVVTVLGESGRPALELESIDGLVKVTALPKNSSSKRDRVSVEDLSAAVNAL